VRDGSLVRVRTADRVATITLHRPEARNALSARLCGQLRAALDAADRVDDVDAIVLTGTDPAFCAGLDLCEYERLGHAPDGTSETILAVGELATPVIGAINGVAVTGGLELALGCDFLVASERAFFADTHARVGVLPGGGLSVRLPQAVGLRRAKEMSFTGAFVDAAEALRIGLVNHVVPHAELLPTAHRLAAAVATNGGGRVAALKALYREVTGMPFGAALDHEREPAAQRRRRGRTTVAPAAVIARGREQVRS
jgi:enoyl-CoA hydratase/carnithine racemase